MTFPFLFRIFKTRCGMQSHDLLESVMFLLIRNMNLMYLITKLCLHFVRHIAFEFYAKNNNNLLSMPPERIELPTPGLLRITRVQDQCSTAELKRLSRYKVYLNT